MIVEIKEKDKKILTDYIGKDYGKCLYVYIDLCKYNLDNNENFFAWAQYNNNNEIIAVITEYYKGIQLYSKNVDFNQDEIAEFIHAKNPSIVLGIKETIDKMKPYMPGYTEELGTVGQIRELKYPANKDAYSAPVEELEDIVKVVAADEAIGQPYGFDSLYTQYKERKEENFGRNFVLRDRENDNRIIGHAGTYAELSELAVVGGVITAPEYRGKGFSKETLAALCEELLSEGKDVFSFYYIPAATKMHTGVGFEKIGDWAKLIK